MVKLGFISPSDTACLEQGLRIILLNLKVVMGHAILTKLIGLVDKQTFSDLPTHLHLFYRIFHANRTNKCNFFLVYSVILGIFWVTLSCKHMWGSVRVIWMILACATYTHFIYHPMWASCSELQYSKTWWDKNLKSNIHEYLTISWP